MSVFEDALVFAMHAHSGQRRKYSDIPYILHPMEVSTVIASITCDQEVMAAGLLHDVVEDCGVLPEELEEKFGSKVRDLVCAESEDKMADLPPQATWVKRKEQSLLHLKNTTDINVKILWLADKLSNMRSFYREFQKNGNAIWNRLHQNDPKKQAWYYYSIADSVKELAYTSAYQEYLFLLNEIFSEGEQL